MNPVPVTGGFDSPPDYRNIPFSLVALASPIPSSYFAPNWQGLPIWDQGPIGSCVGHGTAKLQQENEQVETTKIVPLSARFIYAMCKKVDGIAGEGTYFKYGVDTLYKYGCCTEGLLKNRTDISHAQYIDPSNITPEVLEEAKKYKIKSYAQVGRGSSIPKDELKRAIIQGNGVQLGVILDQAWWTDGNGHSSYAPKDVVPVRPPKSVYSGHCIYVYGYEDVGDETRFWFINSFGQHWGKNGTSYFNYSEYKNWFREAWTVVDLPDDVLGPVTDLPPASQFNHVFNTNLNRGQNNDEVKQLQIALKILGFLSITDTELGPYGPKTQAAVYAFQKAKGIPGPLFFGFYFGSKTRAALNKALLK